MKKKLPQGLGAFLLTLCAIPASAYDFEVNGIYYDVISFTELTCRVVENGEEETYSGTVTIPDVVKYNSRELKVTEIGGNAFMDCSKLDNVIIGNNVVSINDNATYPGGAFYNSSIEEVVLGEQVESIGSYAFRYCQKLSKVTTNGNLKTIGELAFESTPNLLELSLPEGLESVGYAAFRSSGITAINIPSTVTTLGTYCFQYARSLTSVTFNGTGRLEEIPDYCFYGTGKLTSITIPASVVTISYQAFYGSGITELKGGDNVRTIANQAFANTNLISVDLGPSLKEMAYSAFEGSGDIRTVNCYMPVVPELTGYNEQELFDGKTYIDGVLNVLVGAEAQYENAFGWKNFWNIQPSIENTLDIFSFNVYATVTSGNGKVLINGEDANRIAVKGDSPAIFTFVPDYGCKLTALTFNGEDCLDKVDGSSFKVDEIKETSYLRATYTPTPVQLTIASGVQGIVSLSLPYGTAVECKIGAQDGWEIDKVTFNGNDVTSQVDYEGLYTTPILSVDGTLAVSYFSTGDTGIEGVGMLNSIHVIPNAGSITISGADDNDLVEVFDTDGRKLFSTYAKTIELPSAIYLVTVGGRTFKVAL